MKILNHDRKNSIKSNTIETVKPDDGHVEGENPEIVGAPYDSGNVAEVRPPTCWFVLDVHAAVRTMMGSEVPVPAGTMH